MNCSSQTAYLLQLTTVSAEAVPGLISHLVWQTASNAGCLQDSARVTFLPGMSDSSYLRVRCMCRLGDKAKLLARAAAYRLLQYVYQHMDPDTIKTKVLGPAGGEQVSSGLSVTVGCCQMLSSRVAAHETDRAHTISFTAATCEIHLSCRSMQRF